jgi:hypothetical protein
MMNRKSMVRLLVIIAALTFVCVIAIGLMLVAFHVTQKARTTAIMPSSDEEQVRKVIERESSTQPLNLGRDEYLGIEQVDIEGEWAVVEVSARYKATDKAVPTGGGVIIARRIKGEWIAAFKGTERYVEWLEEVPDALIPAEIKPLLR